MHTSSLAESTQKSLRGRSDFNKGSFPFLNPSNRNTLKTVSMRRPRRQRTKSRYNRIQVPDACFYDQILGLIASALKRGHQPANWARYYGCNCSSIVLVLRERHTIISTYGNSVKPDPDSSLSSDVIVGRRTISFGVFYCIASAMFDVVSYTRGKFPIRCGPAPVHM